MKKKIFLSLLIVITGLCITTGCGNSTSNVENMIKDAEILNWNEVRSIVEGNGAKAEDYEKKLYVYTAEVYSISEDYCQLEFNNPINAYLDKETLKSLNKGDVITVVGKLVDIGSFPKLKNAVKLDDETIKNNFVMAIIETSGIRKLKYSDYVVDEKTHLVTSYKTSGDENGTHKLKYDNNGNLIEDLFEKTIVSYGSDKNIYTYDSNKNVLTEEVYSVKNGDETKNQHWDYTYEFDSNNRVTKKTGVNTLGDNYTMVYTYEYDDNDNVIKETQISPRSTYVIDYEYDEFNNRITEKSYNVEKPSSKTTTTNTYSIVAKK